MNYRVFNTWDGIEQDIYCTRVFFGVGEYGTIEHNVVCQLYIDNDDIIAKISTNSCLPTRHWTDYADAYNRAVDFVRRYGLKT